MTKSGKECIFPFKNRSNTGKEKIFNKCIVHKQVDTNTRPQDSIGNMLVCPIKTNKTLGTKRGEDFDICVDYDIDDIDYSKWEFIEGALGPIKSKSGKKMAPPILKQYSKDNKTDIKDRKVFRTVKEAIDVCSTRKACKGVTESPKHRITLRTDSKVLPNTEGDWISWIKK